MNDRATRTRRSERSRAGGVAAAWLIAIAGTAVTLGAMMGLGGESDESRAVADEAVRYGRTVRPILSDACFRCHGGDEAARKADLRLDERESVTKDRGGIVAITPGRLEASEVWRRINSTDPDEMMPPPESRRPLTADEKAVLGRWIEQGAVYERHWSLIPPERHEAPAVMDTAWARGEIDRFVLANLESKGVRPSPEADRATLLRRVYLDLTGLPPTPEEIDSFVDDNAADAYERRVETIFASGLSRQRMAERLASPWLDASRYADTSGIHTDNGRQMWLWRDWVLEAFRSNMPFDRFLTEQIAGDLVPDATVQQRIASGFNRNHVTTDEGGAIAEEYLVEYAVDRVSTTSTVFLGMTMGCARCHDHKYDPISHEEFYSAYAFFNSVEEPGLYSQTADANRAYEPFLEAPTEAQRIALEAVAKRAADLRAALDAPIEGEEAKRTAFALSAVQAGGVRWTMPEVVEAVSTDAGVKLTLQEDGSLLASGARPANEDYAITVRTREVDQRLLMIEALPDARNFVGRSDHGNAVVSGITVEKRIGEVWESVGVRWVWSDHSQSDLDFDIINVIDAGDELEWAANGHKRASGRVMVMMLEEPVGSGDGVDVRVTVRQQSEYSDHSLGRVRVRMSALDDAGSSRLPLAFGRWYEAGPFASSVASVFEEAFGPETSGTLDRTAEFGDKKRKWKYNEALVDGRPVATSSGVGAHYIGRFIYSPDRRKLKVSLGSDDGFKLFVNGVEAAQRKIDRGVLADQDSATIELMPGKNVLVLKIANTGGEGGYYFRPVFEGDSLDGPLMLAMVPNEDWSAPQADEFAAAWRRRFSEEYRVAQDGLAAAARERAMVDAAVPRAMVMKELPAPRPTFVLERGQYDKPNMKRPVKRSVPRAWGELPKGAPENRLGLAQWMTSAENPLVARVAVNRLWELVFGTGLVRTSDDFGLQGEWPSHPELLDTLAVDYREGGWDSQAMLKRIVLSSTYRQASRVRTELAEQDPNNRWLAFYPRRRLSAEQIRDGALFASGLLVEKLGGPSVKIYQPEGLWQEVSMPASNTREYERGQGEDLYRRSVYTYFKRAVPPPTMQTLDAPAREACMIRRTTTNTPLQALAMWNGTQFVEAARVLAQRTLAEPGEDAARMTTMFRRCTGRVPEAEELEALLGALVDLRVRFGADAEAAAGLLTVGDAMVPESADRPELAAWAMVAGSVLNLHETITQD